MAKFKTTPEQEEKINRLIADMTPAEKVGQLHQLSPSIVGGFDVSFEELIEMLADGRITNEEFGKLMANAERDYHEEDIRAGRVSSFLLDDAAKANELQKIAVEESRLGIPLLFGLDVIHGFQTVFPIPLAETCTWDEQLFEESAAIAAEEASAHNIHWTFAPMVDISRDARWGRISESPGEDPYLASVYARAKVRGFQGQTPSDRHHIASCLKHFVAYGAAESGQDYNTVSMAKSMLHGGYLPPVKAAVEEGAMTVMAAFNDYNGVPCTVNGYLLREVLKEAYGFEGFVVSDANAVWECVAHGIAADAAEAAEKSIGAGLDMDMGSGAYDKHLAQLVKSGAVDLAKLDEAVRRVLRVKMALGLFERPYVEEARMNQYEELPKEHLSAALETAKRSIVLLKNEDVLPLKKEQKIALVGELAGLSEEVLGAWAMCGRKKDCISVYEGLKLSGADVHFNSCQDQEGGFDEAALKIAAADADVIVAVVGETSSMSGEAASRADITLPAAHRELLKAAASTGKPVVAVLMNGRPLALAWEQEHVTAIVEAWQLGIQMGNAVAQVLFGEYNPSGRLCCTFPAMTGQCPRYYNHPSTGRPGSKGKFTSRYLDAPLEPLYPFGYGLSYTAFEYLDLVLERKEGKIIAGVTVRNAGGTAGEETVQVYIQDVAASLVRPVKELKGYQKVKLLPGEKAEIKITIEDNALGFYDDDMNYRMEDGLFRVYAGGNSRDFLMAEIKIKF